MNDVETRLRDALTARADAVRHDPEAYAAVVARRSGRHVNRLRALAATAATVAAVTAVVVVARPVERPGTPPATAPQSSVAPAPTAWIGEVNGAAQLWLNGFDGGRDSAGERVTAVAAFGDSKRFVYATVADRQCTTELVRRDVTRNAPSKKRTVLYRVKGSDVPGEVTAMAVSPDGRRLAYLMHPADRRTGRCADALELRVRELATGREQAWREPDAPTPERSFSVAELSSMSWSADGRQVAAGAAFEVVDTTAAGRVLRRLADQAVFIGDQLCMLQDRTFRGRTGEVVGYLLCPRSEQSGVHVLDGNRPVRLLIPAPGDGHYVNSGVQFDRSGDHAFLLLGNQTGEDRLYRWDAGRDLRPVDTGDDEVEAIDW